MHADLLPCLKPRGGVVLIATAYHEMDLMMRLEREHSDLWRVVRLPALSEGEGDPLGRAEGDAAMGRRSGVRLCARSCWNCAPNTKSTAGCATGIRSTRAARVRPKARCSGPARCRCSMRCRLAHGCWSRRAAGISPRPPGAATGRSG